MLAIRDQNSLSPGNALPTTSLDPAIAESISVVNIADPWTILDLNARPNTLFLDPTFLRKVSKVEA